MNYAKHYERLIERARTRKLECYVEKHHIIPKCMGGDNSRGNLVELTPEEHYVAHQLLIKINPGNPKLVYSAWVMASGKERNNKRYGWIRRRHAKSISEHLTGYKRGPFSDEHKAKLSAAKKGRTLPEEQKKKIAASMKAHANTDEAKAIVSATHTGRLRSIETKARISSSNTGKKNTIMECPHCKKSGGRTNMLRYHFDNCKVNHG
jgi:hypothetical protein